MTIGNNVVIGAGSVVTQNIPDNYIITGNPAIIIGSTAEFIEKHKEKMKTAPIFTSEGQLTSVVSDDLKSKWNIN